MKLYSGLATVVLTFSFILLTNCKKNDIEATVTIDKNNISLKAAAGKDSIIISSNTDWTITGMPSWLTITPASGSGETKVLVSYLANNTTNKRSAVLTVQAAGVSPLTLTATQDQLDVVINFFTPHACGDSVITINGRGFSNLLAENIVKINGGQATVNTATSTLLSVTVPSKIGSGRIQVTVNTKADTSDFDFIYDWKGIVTVIAGGVAGYEDGTGANAKFWHPAGIDFDAAGNLYIADYANNKMRKMTQAAVVTTLPGRIPHYANPTGPNTDFNLPQDVCVDALGNVFVVELNANAISKITPAGVVSLLAGGDPNGGQYSDGTGTNAHFYWPACIALDPSGNMFLTDSKNHRIRKITQGGVVTTIAGSLQAYADGTGAGANFNTPFGIALDISGNYLVADFYNNRIRKVTPAGVVTSFAGNGSHGYADGTLSTANIYQPFAIAADNFGNIYLSDGSGNGTLRWITPSGRVNTIIPSIPLSIIQGIAILPDGTVYVADYYNNRICKLLIK
jgi:hypothetical protein